MQNEKICTNIVKAYHTAFINSDRTSNIELQPRLLLNDPKRNQKVLHTLSNELQKCEAFAISVAFITESGIAPLKGILDELERKGVKGRIITTDYLTFSQPKALEDLLRFKNIELRMFKTNKDKGFHTKSYMFKRNGHYSFIIGSSNLTARALCLNHEWNTRIVSMETGAMAQSLQKEFELIWNDPSCQDYTLLRNQYEERYKRNTRKRSLWVESEFEDDLPEGLALKPNLMQAGFIDNLKTLQQNGAQKALLISATGTGKTYASAFAMRELQSPKVLFIVHREQIARKALASYRKVFGASRTMGLLSGNSKDENKQYMFATVQTLSKPENLHKYHPTAFDHIVIDEVHHAAASSYKRIMDYFKPRLWLGMTGSPDRPDGGNIYELFDHNIAYEIRLQHALEEDLLCPFHYFGITDIVIDGQLPTDDGDSYNFNQLQIQQRVDHMLEKALKYGYSGDRVKGLVFSRSIKEAKELSEEFNRRGLKTTYLTGANSQNEREEAIAKLVSDNPNEEHYDYIFTQDIFNEGVDIPEVNQVLMVRPTESPIVFIQQLGRGLRKSRGKEFVVILDFIGNYKNNFLIPVALSGDNSYNKDNLRRYVATGTQVIPGISTVYFDEVARKEIYAAIDNASTQQLMFLRGKYVELKNKLGRIPSIKEFDDYGSIDVLKIFNKYGSYHTFLQKVEPQYKTTFTVEEEQILKYVSTKLAAGKRIHELALLERLLITPSFPLSSFDSYMSQRYDVCVKPKDIDSAISVLTNQFEEPAKREKLNACVFLKKNDKEFGMVSTFARYLSNADFKNAIKALVDFGIHRFEKNYKHRYKDTNLVLYAKYTYEDVCRLLNWDSKMNAQNIGGYFYHQKSKTLPVFINYHKAENAIQYEDRFVSSSELIALSKHPRRLDSPDANHIFKRTEADKDNRIYLFVRKNKDDKEAKEFYFLGEIEAVGSPREVKLDASNDTAFEIDYRLDVPVRADIYDYLIGD